MSVLDKKKKIFGNIAAAKTLIDGLPKLSLKSSFSSLTSGGDVIGFLMDLVTSLTGYKALLDSIVNTLSFSLTEIEKDVKKNIKTILKGIVNCGVNPSIPNFLLPTGVGLTFEASKIDFFDIFKIDPNSEAGKLVYNDITPILTDSSDLNTFLFGVIQDDGVTHSWKNILDITFNSIGNGNRPNNSFTIKVTNTYANKKLTDLNNDFIDSFEMFNQTNIINKILDLIYGSISVSVSKSRKQLEVEEQVNSVIESISNADTVDIDDSYFEFSNDEIYQQELKADYKKNGVLPLDCCNKVPATMPISFLTNFTNDMSTAINISEKRTVITNNLEKMAEQNTVNVNNDTDKLTVKVNFIQEIIKTLVNGITTMIISPKIIMIFLINFKIIYGIVENFDGPVDFMKKNKNLFTGIIKDVTAQIVKNLLTLAMTEITRLVAATQVKKQIEKFNTKQAQILSLIGISPDVINQIKTL